MGFLVLGGILSLLPLLRGRALAPVLALAPALAFAPAAAPPLARAPAVAVAPAFAPALALTPALAFAALAPAVALALTPAVAFALADASDCALRVFGASKPSPQFRIGLKEVEDRIEASGQKP